MKSETTSIERGRRLAVLIAATLVLCLGSLPQVAFSGAVAECGNGIREDQEQCDLGNGISGRALVLSYNGDPHGCCTESCTFRSPADTCRPADGLCDVAETCTGSSPFCPADAIAATNDVCRPEAGLCDVAEVCDGTSKECPADAFLPSNVVCNSSQGRGLQCDPDEVCTGVGPDCPPDVNNCDVPTPSPSPSPTASPVPAVTCPVAPVDPVDCRQFVTPRRHRLAITNWNGKFDRRDRVEWGWRRGQSTVFADYGNPATGGTSYAVCMYDGAGTLVLAASVPSGSKWKASSYSYTYTNPALDEFGIRRISLKSRGAAVGRAAIRVVAAGRETTLGNPAPGANFPILGPFPIPAAPAPIRFQLINSIGNCWEGRYQNNIRRNAVINTHVSRLRAKND